MQPVTAEAEQILPAACARCLARSSFALAAFCLQPPRWRHPGNTKSPGWAWLGSGGYAGSSPKQPWVVSPDTGRLMCSRRGWVLGARETFLHGPLRAPILWQPLGAILCILPQHDSTRWGAEAYTLAPSPGVPTWGSGSLVALRVNGGCRWWTWGHIMARGVVALAVCLSVGTAVRPCHLSTASPWPPPARRPWWGHGWGEGTGWEDRAGGSRSSAPNL